MFSLPFWALCAVVAQPILPGLLTSALVVLAPMTAACIPGARRHATAVQRPLAGRDDTTSIAFANVANGRSFPGRTIKRSQTAAVHPSSAIARTSEDARQMNYRNAATKPIRQQRHCADDPSLARFRVRQERCRTGMPFPRGAVFGGSMSIHPVELAIEV